jgi:uncharacterized protein (DUF2147 family)
MKRSVLLITMIVAVLFLCGNLHAADFSSVVGKWKPKDDETGEFKSIVELYVAKDGTLEGKISKLLKNPGGKCDKCPGDSNYAKDTPVEGMIFVWGVKNVDERGGVIFDPAKAKTYTVKIWKEGNTLKVRGYIAMVYRTQTWYPAD